MKLLGYFLLLALWAPRLLAQTAPAGEFMSGCSGRERIAVLPATDPAYPYAIELARSLTSKGIHVECLRGSKDQHFFHGQEGASSLRTDAGIFDALFLPKGQVFRVEMVEKPENGRYIYSFRGSPAGPPLLDSSKPMVCIQHENVLLLVWGNQPLAERLESVLK